MQKAPQCMVMMSMKPSKIVKCMASGTRVQTLHVVWPFCKIVTHLRKVSFLPPKTKRMVMMKLST